LSGTSTNEEGRFTLETKESFPIQLEISFLGFQSQSLTVPSPTPELTIILVSGSLNMEEMVVTASRVSERVFKSPVAIEKLDHHDIEQSSASFFDAIENVKGVQMTTLSLGFKVPNTRGFANTTNPRFLQMVDGVDTQAPGLGVSIANTVGPTELDVLSVEIAPGASSALYGMNALNGISNTLTKNPFLYEGLSLYQKTGINHVDGVDYPTQLYTETAARFAKVFNKKIAIKLNASYLQGTDWVADDPRDLNPDANSSTNLFGEDNPAKDPLNSYGNERSNRRNLTLADGKRYEVRRTGYFEKDIVTHDYGVNNIKFDGGIYFRPNEKNELSYTYRIGSTDAIYQRGNRIRLDDYQIQQHRIEWQGSHFSIKSYLTIEHTLNSYNLRPLGEVLDKDFKSDNDWYADYTQAYNNQISLGTSAAESHHLARDSADAGRYLPGTPEFDAKVKELSLINNWDVGAQLVMQHKFVQTEGQYDFSNAIKWFDLLVGADYRNYFIQPEGNSFINPDENNPDDLIQYSKFGGFAQGTKRLFHDDLKLIASIRLDKNQYFDPKVNPRFAVVYTLRDHHTFRASYQNGYRFPSLFEGFSTVNNGGVIRYGGLKILTEKLQLFENSYTRTSVDAFNAAIATDINTNGKTKNQAIIDNQTKLARNIYTYLEPEQINSIDFGYRAIVAHDKLFFDVDAYYNIYKNFIDQVEIAVPQSQIGTLDADGNDITIFEMEDRTKNTVYRMWTNSKSVYYNYGLTLGGHYNFYKAFDASGNITYSQLDKVDARDAGLETPFNTPEWIVNLSFGNREVIKNFGFNINWHWQNSFEWKATLANGIIPAYSTWNAQVTLRIPTIHTSAKLGATNLFNNRYRQYEGGPEVGGFYYLALTWGL
jgi:iron complex outermembrane receptor protein